MAFASGAVLLLFCDTAGALRPGRTSLAEAAGGDKAGVAFHLCPTPPVRLQALSFPRLARPVWLPGGGADAPGLIRGNIFYPAGTAWAGADGASGIGLKERV